jgi:RNA polymerase sigma-70 factor, ECF subfamily
MLTPTKLHLTEPADAFEPLLQAARRGDKDAQGRLLEMCRRPLLRLARREARPGLQSKAGPSDAVQEAFVQALREIDTFRGCTPEQLLAWLRVILTNTLATLSRKFGTSKRQVRREVPGDAAQLHGDPSHAVQSAGETVLRREEAGRLEQALERLPGHYAKVIRMRYGENRSFDEIGRLTGRTAEAARKLCARALAEMGRHLAGRGGLRETIEPVETGRQPMSRIRRLPG